MTAFHSYRDNDDRLLIKQEPERTLATRRVSPQKERSRSPQVVRDHKRARKEEPVREKARRKDDNRHQRESGSHRFFE